MAQKNKTMRVVEASVESSASAVEWGAITAGGLAAIGISIILMALGPGVGLATVSAWYLSGPPPASFGITAGIWLIVTQWLASGLGGYLAGRLRKKWVGIRTGEVFFRDAAHGFLAWALATLIIATLITAIAGSAHQAGTVSPETAALTKNATVSLSFYTGVSLLIGAFISGLAGLVGGYHRDD